MKVHITFRFTGDSDHTGTRHFEFEREDFEQMKRDFMAYLNGGPSALRGAFYKCVDSETNQSKDLLLRFDEVLFVEGMNSEAARPAQPTGTTGPLLARLAASSGNGGNGGNAGNGGNSSNGGNGSNSSDHS